jgi:hypothetical protein
MFFILTHVQTLTQVLTWLKQVHFVLHQQNFPFEVNFCDFFFKFVQYTGLLK